MSLRNIWFEFSLVKYLFILLVRYSLGRIDSGFDWNVLWLRMNVFLVNDRLKGLLVMNKMYVVFRVVSKEYGIKFKFLLYKDFVKELLFFKVRILLRDGRGF